MYKVVSSAAVNYGRRRVMTECYGAMQLPVADLYREAMDQLKPYEGGIIPDWADYMTVGERLSLELRRDFTYLHPETLDARCRLVGDTLRLEHPEIFQDYRVLILPGSTAISAANLAKVKQFFDAGGKVIATTCLPDQSVEFGKTAEVQAILRHIFGAQAVAPAPAKPRYPQVTASSAWEAGGHDAALAFDGDPDTRWNARDGMRANQWLEVDFGAPVTFSRVRIREVFDRAQAHRVEAWNGQEWRITADKPGAITFSAKLSGVSNTNPPGDERFSTEVLQEGQLVLRGTTATSCGIKGRVNYVGRVRVLNEGGKLAGGWPMCARTTSSFNPSTPCASPSLRRTGRTPSSTAPRTGFMRRSSPCGTVSANRTHAIKEGENTKRHLFETLTRYLKENHPLAP